MDGSFAPPPAYAPTSNAGYPGGAPQPQQQYPPQSYQTPYGQPYPPQPYPPPGMYAYPQPSGQPYYQQQPQTIYVQQQPQQSTRDDGCLTGCLGALCFCCLLDSICDF